MAEAAPPTPVAPAQQASGKSVLKRSASSINEGDGVVVKIDLTQDEREAEADAFAKALLKLVQTFPVRCVDPVTIGKKTVPLFGEDEEQEDKDMLASDSTTYRRYSDLCDRFRDEMCLLADSLPAAMATYDMMKLLRKQVHRDKLRRLVSDEKKEG